MGDAKELLHSNLHEVFSERNPQRRRAAIERTYTEDVTFIDPEGEFVGRQALNDQATYSATDAHIGPMSVGSWTVVFQGSSVSSFSDNPGNGVYTYLVFMRDKALNYSSAATTARAVVVNGSSPTSLSLSGNVTLDGLFVASGNTLTVGSSYTLAFNAYGIANVSGTVIHQGTITIGSSAAVNFNTGGLYQYDYDGGSLITANWNTGSTCEIIGLKHNTASNLAQTFYNFTLDNLRHFGALKAMGASNPLLLRMILLQSVVVGLLGYGLGVGAAATIGYFTGDTELAFRLPMWLLGFTGVVVLIICALASLISMRKVIKLEPAIVFKG